MVTIEPLEYIGKAKYSRMKQISSVFDAAIERNQKLLDEMMKQSKAKIDEEVNTLFEVKPNEELSSYEVALDF